MSLQLSGDIGVTYTDGSNQPSASSPYVLKNRLVNGSFAIDQRNAGASQTFTAAAAIAYTADRWYGSCTGANITGQRVAGTSPNQYAYRFTGAASNTGTLFGQRIESFNTYDLISTTVTGSVTLKSSSITSVTWTAYYANSSDTFSSKTSIATGTLTINSTATRYSFSFDAGANAGNGIAIEFTTGALTATNTLQYENAQIEIGSTATPFERRLYNQELANCQRYYYKLFPNASAKALGACALNVSTTVNNTVTTFPTPMRTRPTALEQTGTASNYQVRSGSGTTACSAVPAFGSSETEFALTDFTVASGLTAGQAAIGRTASTSAFLAWSAEL
jgi:hypothetical protein